MKTHLLIVIFYTEVCELKVLNCLKNFLIIIVLTYKTLKKTPNNFTGTLKEKYFFCVFTSMNN